MELAGETYPNLRHLFGPIADDIERWENKKPEPAISTGLGSLDKLLEGGYRPGQVIVVAAQTNHGKSAFGLTAARNSAEAGRPSMIFTHEMSREMMTCRALQQLTGISANRIQGKETAGEYALTEDERRLLEPAQEHLRATPLHLYCGDLLNAENVAYYMTQLVAEDGIELFVFDYIQRMVHSDNKAAGIGELMAAISNCAKNEVNKPVIVLAQLNRGLKCPGQDDIKDSASIAHEADAIIILSPENDKPWEYTGEPFQAKLTKMRAGNTGQTQLTFVPYRVEFTDG